MNRYASDKSSRLTRFLYLENRNLSLDYVESTVPTCATISNAFTFAQFSMVHCFCLATAVMAAMAAPPPPNNAFVIVLPAEMHNIGLNTE